MCDNVFKLLFMYLVFVGMYVRGRIIVKLDKRPHTGFCLRFVS